MNTVLALVFIATLFHCGQALYLPPPPLDAVPLALPALGCSDSCMVPSLPAHNLANAITASISTAVPPLLEAALPLLLKTVLAATPPLLGVPPCGSCASPLVLPAPPSCCNSCAAPLVLPAPSPAPIMIAAVSPCGGGYYY